VPTGGTDHQTFGPYNRNDIGEMDKHTGPIEMQRQLTPQNARLLRPKTVLYISQNINITADTQLPYSKSVRVPWFFPRQLTLTSNMDLTVTGLKFLVTQFPPTPTLLFPRFPTTRQTYRLAYVTRYM